MRTAFDFSPLFRSTIGFERMQQLLDAALRADDQAFSYPPYNIEAVGEDAYRLTMAVAGFAPEDLEVTATENTLVVAGKANRSENEVSYLHRGIAGRSFERRFELAEHVRATGASLVNGLLNIELKREVPEEMKPRRIPVVTRAIEKKAA